MSILVKRCQGDLILMFAQRCCHRKGHLSLTNALGWGACSLGLALGAPLDCLCPWG